MGLFLGGEAASGRGSGGGASFPQSVPRHPTSACGALGRVAKRTRVAQGWQGLTGLIQLAERPPLLRNSGPAGAELRAAALCASSLCIWIQSLPLWHAPTPGTCGSHPPLRREDDLGLIGKVEKLCGCLSPINAKGGSRKGVWKGV